MKHCLRLALAFSVLAVALPSLSRAQSAVETDEPDIQPIHDYRLLVLSAFRNQDFSALEKMAIAANSPRERFIGGGSKLAVFYGMLRGPGSLTASEDRWTAHLARLQRWIDAMPGSAIPRTALATAYVRYAWKARGNGWADTVTEDGWKAFRNRVQQARTILEGAEAMPDRDAQWFATMQVVALAQDWNRGDFRTLSESAMAAMPGYVPVYENGVNFLLPKWHGKKGEAVAFLSDACDRIGGAEGDALYFKTVMAFNLRRTPELLEASWDRVKRGFAATEELYTSTNRQRNAIAYLALQAGDTSFAKDMFARIGTDWDQSVWRSKPSFESARSKLSLHEITSAKLE